MSTLTLSTMIRRSTSWRHHPQLNCWLSVYRRSTWFDGLCDCHLWPSPWSTSWRRSPHWACTDQHGVMSCVTFTFDPHFGTLIVGLAIGVIQNLAFAWTEKIFGVTLPLCCNLDLVWPWPLTDECIHKISYSMVWPNLPWLCLDLCFCCDLHL